MSGLTLPTTTNRSVAARVWVVSDLQTNDAAESRRCLGAATDDIGRAAFGIDQLWYLGDAVSGSDVERNEEVARVQLELLSDLGVPCRYVMGNHDLDAPRSDPGLGMAFYDRVSADPNWLTTTSPEEFYFVDRVGEHTVLFLSDHVAPDRSWSVSHGQVSGDESAYPYDESDYRAALEEATAPGRPLIVAGHNAFSGGNRAAELQDWFTPLPLETVIHLYGHAHVGDEKHMPYDSGRNAYRSVSGVDHHQVPQVDVASLEDRRSDVIRSAVLETFADGGCAVHLRDHTNRAWLESYATYGPQRPYVVRLSDGDAEVELRHKTQRDQLVAVLDHLAEAHGLFEKIELPEAGDGSVTVASEPKHPDGSEMYQPQALANGLFVEGRIGKADKRRAIAELADRCGLTVAFDGLWTAFGT